MVNAFMGGISTKSLRGELESLKDFKKRVDNILKDLDGSKAAQSNVRQQQVGRASFGGEFAEAQDLYLEYNRVHTQLTSMSGVLGRQIEAMGIAVHAADVGFGNLEEDTQRRFWALQDQAALHEQQTRRPGGAAREDDVQAVF